MDTQNGHTTHLLRTFPNGMRYILLDEETVAKLTIQGNKRGLMYLVSQVKSSDKRIERSFIIAAKLKRGITSPREILK